MIHPRSCCVHVLCFVTTTIFFFFWRIAFPREFVENVGTRAKKRELSRSNSIGRFAYSRARLKTESDTGERQ